MCEQSQGRPGGVMFKLSPEEQGGADWETSEGMSIPDGKDNRNKGPESPEERGRAE